MSLCKDYKQILRRQCSFVHVSSPRIPLGQACYILCESRVPGNGSSRLPSKFPYLSVRLFARNFHICQPWSCVCSKGSWCYAKDNNNSNSHNSIQSMIVSNLQMGPLRLRRLISFLSITEEREASPEPRSSHSRMVHSLANC